jgi:hypothetical protein
MGVFIKKGVLPRYSERCHLFYPLTFIYPHTLFHTMGDKRVQIKVTATTREALRKRGRKDDTYDYIIQELLRGAEEKR